MHFYEVWVRSHRYQKNSALTYSSELQLQPGSIVYVPLQKEAVLGFVTRKATKPQFDCRQIVSAPDIPSLPQPSLELFRWLQAYYPGPSGPLTQLFLPAKIGPTDEPESSIAPKQSIDLNAEQHKALTQISTAGTYVVHGRTGSGKTRLYAALAQKQLQQGRSVIVLTPEISLTPQLVLNLERELGVTAVVLNSRLTPKQRADAWARLLSSNQPQLVIGPRSAIFAPLANIGLIIMDEAHEPAYKQEQQPYYYTPRVAAKLAQLHNATLVVGSATPPVSEYYLAVQKNRPIIRLSALATGQDHDVQQVIVDMKDRSQFSQKSAHLSDALIKAIRNALKNNEQSMLYLNRRGTARLCLCQNCGWQATCSHCDIPMTYHGDTHELRCHTCGIHEPLRTNCPDCGYTDLLFRTAGTKAIAEEVARLFPEARIQRFDTDNTKADRFEEHFTDIQTGNVDILIGTQLLAKGLDLPKLSTLGIVLADSSLSIPDYTSQERTYQLLQQVLGRIGRGHTHSAIAIVQTYNPENTTLQTALAGDWNSFYEREIAERKEFLFPPFCHMLKLICRRKTSASAEKASRAFLSKLSKISGDELVIEGPTPAFHERSAGFYQWQIVIKSSNRSSLIKVINHLPTSGWTYDIDPINLL